MSVQRRVEHRRGPLNRWDERVRQLRLQRQRARSGERGIHGQLLLPGAGGEDAGAEDGGRGEAGDEARVEDGAPGSDHDQFLGMPYFIPASTRALTIWRWKMRNTTSTGTTARVAAAMMMS